MWKNYLLTAYRNLIRQKSFTFINISGLAIGMAVAILIFSWVAHELSYDKFNRKSDRLFRLVQTQHYTSGPLTTVCMPGPIARDVKEEYPEILNSFMYYEVGAIVSYDGKIFSEKIRMADPELFRMFDFDFIHGDPANAYQDVTSVILTDEYAKKYFGEDDPIGKVLRLNDEHNFKVAGIVKKMPSNSSFVFDICIPFEFIEEIGFRVDRYGNNTFYSYVELHPDADYHDVNMKIKDFIVSKTRTEGEPDDEIDLFLFPLEKIHLYSVRGEGGDIQYVYMFSGIALLILVIACINFMNLTTARSIRRNREIGLRKTFGAFRGQITIQFLVETMFMTFIALIIALALVNIAFPWFAELTEKDLVFNLLDWRLLLLVICLGLFVGFLAGSYPALYMSKYDPLKVLRDFSSGSRKSAFLRKVLVVLQFVISVVLIICTLVISRQLSYLQNKKLGVNKENVIFQYMQGNTRENYEVLKNELLKNPAIEVVSRANSLPFFNGSNSGGFDWQDKDTDDELLIGFGFVDFNYEKTFDLKMIDGRFFDESFSTDTASVILNQNAIKAMNLEDPVGKWLDWGDNARFNIIGVMSDFHFLPLQYEISPLLFLYTPSRCRYLYMRIHPDKHDEAIKYAEDTWNKINPEFPFEYRFVDASYDMIYQDEKKTGELFRYFTMLAIFISCMGLFGLVAFMTEQRTREIGIRKVLGSSVGTIVFLVMKNFLFLVIIANLIAVPVAWYTMNNWLSNYAYQTEISVWFFLVAIIVSIVIATLTIIFLAMRAALRNPVDSIRYE